MLTTEAQQPQHRSWIASAALGVVAIAASALIALLVIQGRWIEGLALVAGFPAFLAIQRQPLVIIGIWLALYPFLSGAADGGDAKVAVWLIHRLAPVATLIIVLVSSSTRASNRRLSKLGVAELFMAAYAVASLLSILYTSDAIVASVRTFYARTIIPMVLYLLIRLLKPEQKQLARLAPVLIFFLASQALIGAAQWFAPSALPSQWLDRAGTRTTGSLGQPGVFGTSVLFAGLLLLHVGLSGHSRRLRMVAVPAFIGSLLLCALTFSRGMWLAATVAVFGIYFVYRKAARKILAIGLVIAILAILSTSLAPTTEYFEQRFYSAQSQQSALSRLPVVIASVRMFEEKPLSGWGYGNFNKYDRQFQSSLDGLFVPEKDHSSHNLILTIAAEQGIPGLITYYGPVLYWLARTIRSRRRFTRDSTRLVVTLWMVIAAHFVVNNFAVMKSSFGLGIWWMTVGMIGVVVTGVGSAPAPAERDLAFKT